jgi:hypothetical protein
MKIDEETRKAMSGGSFCALRNLLVNGEVQPALLNSEPAISLNRNAIAEDEVHVLLVRRH